MCFGLFLSPPFSRRCCLDHSSSLSAPGTYCLRCKELLAVAAVPDSSSLVLFLQLVSEKVGGAEGTKLDDDFKEMEKVSREQENSLKLAI